MIIGCFTYSTATPYTCEVAGGLAALIRFGGAIQQNPHCLSAVGLFLWYIRL